MAFSRNAKKSLPYITISVINISIFGYAIREGKKANEWYRKQPLEKQRELYNACPLQKYGSSNDAIAAIRERVELHRPAQRMMKPVIPFDETQKNLTNNNEGSYVKKTF